MFVFEGFVHGAYNVIGYCYLAFPTVIHNDGPGKIRQLNFACIVRTYVSKFTLTDSREAIQYTITCYGMFMDISLLCCVIPFNCGLCNVHIFLL